MRSSLLTLGVTLPVLGIALLAAGCNGTAGTPALGPGPLSGRPAPASTTSFNDYTTYGYDLQHDGFNPNSAAFTSSSLPQLHLAWQASLSDYNTQTQPIVVTNVAGHSALLIVGGGTGNAYAYDALSGTQVWHRPLGQQLFSCGNGTAYFGIGGTAVYDPVAHVIYVPDDRSSKVNGPAKNTIYELNPSNGAVIASVNISPKPLRGEISFMHTGLTEAPNGLIYAGTSSTCDISSWRGRVVAVTSGSLNLVGTFFTTWKHGGNYSGGGVWGWGGVSVDSAGNVYTGSGNADTSTGPQPPFVQAPNEHVGYAEHLVKLTPYVSSVVDDNYPGFVYQGVSQDLDFSGTPVLFQPVGCDAMTASQGKSGQVIVYDTQNIGQGPLAQFQFSESNFAGVYIGNPAYSPLTGLLYVAVTSKMGGSIRPPGLVAISPAGCSSFNILWGTAFGPDSYSYGSEPPRGAPAATAGGLIFATSPCTVTKRGTCGKPSGSPNGALWVLDATSGNVLNGGKPILTTPDIIRMPPTIDGTWLWVLDNSGNLYGLTLDSAHAPIRSVFRKSSPRSHYRWRS